MPDPGSRPLVAWLSVASLAFGTFVMVSAEFLPIGLLSPIARDLGVSEGTAGLMVTTPGFAAALAAPAASFGLQRVDRRRVLLGLTALVLASTVLSAFVASFGALLVARLLLGVAVGGFWAFAGAVARRLVEERHGATATAIVMAGIALGTVAGLPLGTVIGDLAGWRRAFEAGAAMAAAAFVVQWLLLPRLAPPGGARPPDIVSATREPALRPVFAFASLVVFGHFAAYTYLEPYLTRHVGLDAHGLGLALAGYGVAGLAGNFIAARLARHGARRIFALATALLGASVFALLAAGESPVPACIAVVAWGLTFGAIPTCIQLWTHDASPQAFEASSALMVTVFQLALATGAFAGGLVADGFAVPDALGAGALVAALGALAMVLLQARRRLAL